MVVISSMSLEFGLTLTGLGVVAMFSALVIIIAVCEVLKRVFKAPETKITSLKTFDEKVILDGNKISVEEEAKIAAAVMAYMNGTQSDAKRIITMRDGNKKK